jgi:hypothetical protein
MPIMPNTTTPITMLPSTTWNRPWISENNDKYHALKTGGKWMMFYDMKDIDQKWAQATNYYNQGLLPGIHCLKASTNFKYNKNQDEKPKEGVIMFYCGSPQDKAQVMLYGTELIKLLDYRHNSGHMYYKSDEKTKQFKKSLYKIKVKRYEPTPLNKDPVIIKIDHIPNPTDYIFFDTETTGTVGAYNYIIQLAYIISRSLI